MNLDNKLIANDTIEYSHADLKMIEVYANILNDVKHNLLDFSVDIDIFTERDKVNRLARHMIHTLSDLFLLIPIKIETNAILNILITNERKKIQASDWSKIIKVKKEQLFNHRSSFTTLIQKIVKIIQKENYAQMLFKLYHVRNTLQHFAYKINSSGSAASNYILSGLSYNIEYTNYKKEDRHANYIFDLFKNDIKRLCDGFYISSTLIELQDYKMIRVRINFDLVQLTYLVMDLVAIFVEELNYMQTTLEKYNQKSLDTYFIDGSKVGSVITRIKNMLLK